jgi:3-hydroxyacyl-[acyl-carrier-protein] dehydratase
MLIPKEQIANHIPQRPPFIMVDNLIRAAENQAESDFEIQAGNLFAAEGKFSVYGMIENIAQTCIAGIAFIGTHNGAPPKDGYIGAISGLKLHDLPPVNSRLKTIATIQYQFDKMFLVKGECFLGDALLVECELKLVGKQN